MKKYFKISKQYKLLTIIFLLLISSVVFLIPKDKEFSNVFSANQDKQKINIENNSSLISSNKLLYSNYSIKQIEIEDYNNAIIINDGITDHLYMSGNNDYGQLGLGDTKSKSFPQEVNFETGTEINEIKQVSLGHSFSSAIVNDELYTWGNNEYGQLGLGNNMTGNRYTSPEKVKFSVGEEMIKVEQVSTAEDYTAAVVNDGENDHLYIWGDNEYDQLGLGDSAQKEIYYSPKEMTEFYYYSYGDPVSLSGKNVEQISLGSDINNPDNVLLIDNELFCWGRYEEVPLFIEIPKTNTWDDEPNIQQISTGRNHSAVVADNELFTWGDNEYGQLGLGYDEDDNIAGNSYHRTLEKVESLPQGNIEQISMGEWTSAAIVDNQLYTWGRGGGMLGLETDDSYFIPQKNETLSDKKTTQVLMGPDIGVAMADNEIYAWGFFANTFPFPVLIPEKISPYLENVQIEIIKENKKSVTISFDFLSNLNISKLNISFRNENSFGWTTKEIVPFKNNFFYEGEITLKNLTPNENYIYNYEIIYLNFQEEEKIIKMDNKSFYKKSVWTWWLTIIVILLALLLIIILFGIYSKRKETK